MYKFEIHMHNKGCSACSSTSVFDLIDKSYEKGYSGLVFTNHFYRGNSAVDRALPWEDFVNVYKNSYLEAEEYAKKYNMVILFGVEHGYDTGKELLIYGLSPDDFIKTPEFRTMDLKGISEFVHENNGLVVVAHPYRVKSWIPEPDKTPDPLLIDGVEAYNDGNTEEENNKAFAFARKHNLLQTSGGDIHNTGSIGNSGIVFEKPVCSREDFVSAIKNKEYKLIIGDEFIDID